MESRFTLVFLAKVLLLALWTALIVSPSHAAVYACPSPNGDTVYQDRPCAKIPTKAPNTSSTSGTNESSSDSQYAFGMHESWFSPPLYAPQPAYCDRLGCDCATQTRNFRRGLAEAVADALFLETAWHRYAEQVIRLENDPPKGLALLELQVGIEESACDIQMSQMTVKNYVEKAVAELTIKANAAISRGNIDPDQCDGSNEKVCADVDAVGLYERVMQDIETLKLPRYFLIAEAD